MPLLSMLKLVEKYVIFTIIFVILKGMIFNDIYGKFILHFRIYVACVADVVLEGVLSDAARFTQPR